MRAVTLGEDEIRKIDAKWIAHATQLLAFAQRQARSLEDGHDALQKTYEAIRSGSRPVPDEADVTFFRFACGVFRSVLSRRWSDATARRETELVDARDDVTPYSPYANPERLVQKKEEHAARAAQRAALAVAFPEGDLCRKVLELICEGTIEPREQAVRLGVPVSKIYDARDRLRHAAERIARAAAASRGRRAAGGAAAEDLHRTVIEEAQADDAMRTIEAMSPEEIARELARAGGEAAPR
jgi:DNA-directed RNA polymerase specialized sigma24 family protein